MEFLGKCLLLETGGKKILAVGDLHLGYEENLNLSGVFVFRKLFENVLSYLEDVFEMAGWVDEVVLLGDVKHKFGKIIGQEWKEFEKLIAFLRGKCGRIVITRGNHDKLLGLIAEKFRVELVDFYCAGETCFFHGHQSFPEIYNDKIKRWVMAHWHPVFQISEEMGVKKERFKCFLVGKFDEREVVIVPSFFEGHLGSLLEDTSFEEQWKLNLKKFEVLVVGDGLEVLEFGDYQKRVLHN